MTLIIIVAAILAICWAVVLWHMYVDDPEGTGPR